MESRVAAIRRPGVISWDMLYGQEPGSLKRHVLLYDELWVPGVGSELSAEEIEQWHLDEEKLALIDWLRSQGLVREPGIDLSNLEGDEVLYALKEMLDESNRAGERGYATPEEAAREGGAAIFNADIALSRMTIYALWRDRQELAYPVFFPFEEFPAVPDTLKQTQEVLALVLKHFPTPAPDVPLEEIVRFKRDPETEYKFQKLWHWMRQVSAQSSDTTQIEEELNWLLVDYEKHLRELSNETGQERLEVLVGLPGELLEDVLKLRFGKLGKRLLQLRRKRIEAHSAEMKLPGSEIAFVTEASRILTPS